MQSVLSEAVVRPDGERYTEASEQMWSAPSNYTSVHFLNTGNAKALVLKWLEFVPCPHWLCLDGTFMRDEASVTVFLTGDEPSSSSLHRDDVSSAFFVCAGEREMWVLPPGHGEEELRLTEQHVSTYDVFNTSDRDIAWRSVKLSAGDWVFMPKGWWHQLVASEGSILISIRLEL